MVNDQSIRILVADDHPVVRRGLRSLIDIEPDLELVGEAADGVEAVKLARSLLPDVILLDLMMPRQTGLEVIHDSYCLQAVDRLSHDFDICVLAEHQPDPLPMEPVTVGDYNPNRSFHVCLPRARCSRPAEA